MIKGTHMRVFLLDDSPILRKEISNMLTSMSPGQVDIVGEASEAEGTEKIILDLKPDVAILDIQITNRSGIEVLKEIKHKIPGLKTIITDQFPDISTPDKCLVPWGRLFSGQTL